MTVEASVTIPGETFSRVALTAGAVELLDKLWLIHGPLMFHQSGGCCDGSSPMCYPAGEFITAEADVLLGVLDITSGSAGRAGPEEDGAPRLIDFWMSREQFEYWRHTHLTVDVVPGRGSGFSVEAPEGKRFLIRSRLMQ
ncbi:DUF779 domain-containing protein [Arthrobacter agilis]|uniref:DUF779 domain-containing protein n=1 Tax=Arthrobacter agilis TaxID=37921 RepID=UPI000B351101|nr:DUF779 domain-containing protein [Arthrobacter agilis]OUM42913.1 UDP-glucose 4-epimerase [Arthrobacter agilis]PPB45858.1 DUF779 domain-containing protein [Arthrobacter agilis]TPV25400.1 DUF779 domain-containing protein [Arthrobacter agilis]WDF32768.1 DUF779 domain-containing protein [Arthrobacter agilis]VDR33134.1 Uncharacterized protein conserved in bacteria [Arthrobacter agilis]